MQKLQSLWKLLIGNFSIHAPNRCLQYVKHKEIVGGGGKTEEKNNRKMEDSPR